MNSLWPSRASGAANDASKKGKEASQPPAAEPPAQKTGVDQDGTVDASAAGPANTSKPPPPPPTSLAKRPLLVRNQQPSAPSIPPAVPSGPAPPIPNTANSNETNDASQPQQQQGQQSQQQQQQNVSPNDSLSLAQLRRIVNDFPNREPIAYDYEYTDMGPLEEEIDEWFMYNFWQWVRLNAANRAFHTAWGKYFASPESSPTESQAQPPPGWDEVDVSTRKEFITSILGHIKPLSDDQDDRMVRGEAIGAVVYLVLGRWTETVTVRKVGMLNGVVEGKCKSAATKVQLDAMKEGVRVLAECGGVEVMWDALRGAFEPFWADEPPQSLQMQAEELIHLMTVMYVVIQVTLEDSAGMEEVRPRLLALNPNLVDFLMLATAKLRWDEAGILPQTQIFLLFWKSILLVFGGMKELAETKKATSEREINEKDMELITASPLDYHVFRQEITSKYPAYVPPQPAIPLEAEHTSLLPHLPSHPPRNTAQTGIISGPPNQTGGGSILNQPVHIATPAPSPPPSPAAGGKGAKKQNYQTNQNFPFMYPPLDATSNSAGGKGGAGLQDLLVGRKWEGSDVPASIMEAGELFSKRVRMTRATRQLWDEREKFLKEGRGGCEGADEDLIDELDLDELTLEEKEELGLVKPGDKDGKASRSGADYGPREVDDNTKRRLDAVEEFYKEALPQLQSVVVVLLKQVLAIASNMVIASPNGQQQGGGPPAGRANGPSQAPGPSGAGGKGPDPGSPSDADVDEMRNREIAAKAATGILILLLKWLKLSHVLKFEYLTQLLLDSCYIPLVLKLFAVHDVQQVVENKLDRLEHSFFYFCGSRAGVIPHPGMPNPTATEFEDVEEVSEEEDDAAPPPIKRRRSPTTTPDQQGASQDAQQSFDAQQQQAPPTRPEVDELGYPVNPLPSEPITDFSRRNFFCLINYLRIMQKICKNKAHRNLLLVQYKSSPILRKTLKVPQQELRLYTLKLFKNQVPYCGRKWRQSNMRVITAVYLYCRPELRDEWLAGSDIDAEVEEALPLEQALRSLTHWFNVRKYPETMAVFDREKGKRVMMEKIERSFFMREMEKLDPGGGLGLGFGFGGDGLMMGPEMMMMGDEQMGYGYMMQQAQMQRELQQQQSYQQMMHAHQQQQYQGQGQGQQQQQQQGGGWEGEGGQPGQGQAWGMS
ncbi:Factor arrest protein 11 [Podospora bellae-mahoneyi]|uniref:Factor arrest protein 11 n=1 Tax=Podospora bellae-mahoneyi TaxID=2093777 RepID=A0ABR0FU58_9PEZI|nr:Factor arrest protein 11 [Podospora bellae-mahoneyi]